MPAYKLTVLCHSPDVTTYLHRCGRCARSTNKGVSLAFEVEGHPVTSALLDKMERHFQTENAEEQAAGRPAVDIAAIGGAFITLVTAADLQEDLQKDVQPTAEVSVAVRRKGLGLAVDAAEAECAAKEEQVDAPAAAAACPCPSPL